MWPPEIATRREDAASRWIFGAAYVRVQMVSAEAAEAFVEEVATLAEAHVRRFEDARKRRTESAARVARRNGMHVVSTRLAPSPSRRRSRTKLMLVTVSR
jgi:hypothetical protein